MEKTTNYWSTGKKKKKKTLLMDFNSFRNTAIM